MLLSRDVICSDGTVQNDGIVSQSKGHLQLDLRGLREAGDKPVPEPVKLVFLRLLQDQRRVVFVGVDVDTDHRCPITTLASGEPPRIAFGQSMLSTTRGFPDFVSRHKIVVFLRKIEKLFCKIGNWNCSKRLGLVFGLLIK